MKKITAHEMIKNLVLVGYNLSELSKFTGVNRVTLSNILKEEVKVSSTVFTKIETFFNKNIEDVEIGKFRDETFMFSNLVDTPDGWQSPCGFVEKGKLPCFKIKTATHEITAAAEHLFQLEDESWVYTKDLTTDSRLLCDNGIEQIVSIEDVGEIPCVDITIKHPNHRYFSNGISSHNTGKSMIAATLIANAQKDGCQHVFYFDAEGGAGRTFFENAGCDPSTIEQILVSDVEDAQIKILDTFSMITEYKESDPDAKFLCVLDSLGALVPAKLFRDAEKDKVTSEMGGRSKICLPGEYEVLMCDGIYKALKDIKIGDEVITHLGRSKKVLDNIPSHHLKVVKLKIKVNGELKEFKMSLNHKMMVLRNNKLSFIEAHDLQKTDKLLKFNF